MIVTPVGYRKSPISAEFELYCSSLDNHFLFYKAPSQVETLVALFSSSVNQ
jgi:hypothetical protein